MLLKIYKKIYKKINKKISNIYKIINYETVFLLFSFVIWPQELIH